MGVGVGAGGGGGAEGGGGGFGWDPLLLRSPYGPCRRRAENFLSLNPLGAKGAEAKFWLSASNIEKGGGGGVLIKPRTLVRRGDSCRRFDPRPDPLGSPR